MGESHYVAQAALELEILPLSLPKGSDYMRAPHLSLFVLSLTVKSWFSNSPLCLFAVLEIVHPFVCKVLLDLQTALSYEL